MAISEKTPYGNITITDSIFADIVKTALYNSGFYDTLWISTKRGKIISSEGFSPSAIAPYIKAELNDEGNAVITFYVVIKFGSSIKYVTNTFADYVKREFDDRCDITLSAVNITVAGIKSKNIARRKVEVSRIYEP